MKFNEFEIGQYLVDAIKQMGFDTPTPIQEKAIPALLDGKDVIARAQTGTGKTAAFAIPMIEKIDKYEGIQGLVLVPTRELAKQVSDEIEKLAKFKKIVKVTSVYGGADMRRQIKAIKGGANIVIGTPGRVMDHMRRGSIKLDFLKYLVLDEADEMFDMGFRDDMKTIIDQTNDERQTCFFSATFANDIMDFSRMYQENPEKIVIESEELTVSNIKQYYLEMKSSMKTEILNRVLSIYKPRLSIVFCNTKRMVDNLVIDLTKKGYNVDTLHGDLKQNQRDNVMKKFRNNTIDILVATDIAARGLDVEDVDIVFNYDLPQQNDYYVHRIGRTARAGKEGLSFTFLTEKDRHKLGPIEKYTNAKMEKMELPTIYDVKVANTDLLEELINEQIKLKEDLSPYGQVLNKILEEGNSLYDIALSLMKIVDNSKNSFESEELANVDFGKKFEIQGGKTRGKKAKGQKIKGPKMFINKGRRDGVDVDIIIKAIKKYTNVSASEVGNINIMQNFSFIEVPVSKLNGAIKDLNGKKLKGKVIKVEYSDK